MRFRSYKYHLLVWIFYCVLIIPLDYLNLGADFRIARELIVIVMEVWIFYSFVWSLSHSGFRKPYFPLQAICFFAMSYMGTLAINYIRSRFAIHYGFKPPFETVRDAFIDTFFWYIHFSIYAIGYFYFKLSFQKLEEIKGLALKQLTIENEKLELMNKNSQLQQDLLQSENNFLRAQINPHFLYNCLNLFYSKTFQQQPKVADAIMMLSQIMRYSITDFSGTGGLASLEEEAAHIERVIELNRFRFSDALQITFWVQGDPAGKKIVPMLLMTLVENVFKHGDLQDAASPAEIACLVDEAQGTVCFVTRNKRDAVRRADSTGVGIINIRQRLKLLYEDRFDLRITDDGQTFKTELMIPYFIAN